MVKENRNANKIMFVCLILLVLVIVGYGVRSINDTIENLDSKVDTVLSYEEVRYDELVKQTEITINNTKEDIYSNIINYIKDSIVTNGYVQIGLGNNETLVLVPYRGE